MFPALFASQTSLFLSLSARLCDEMKSLSHFVKGFPVATQHCSGVSAPEVAESSLEVCTWWGEQKWKIAFHFFFFELNFQDFFFATLILIQATCRLTLKHEVACWRRGKQFCLVAMGARLILELGTAVVLLSNLLPTYFPPLLAGLMICTECPFVLHLQYMPYCLTPIIDMKLFQSYLCA